MHSRNIAYIGKLDHLRFLAALMVLMFHSNLWYFSTWNLRDTIFIPLFDQGYTGVSLFMVISGMILTVITYDKAINVKAFFVNRILRIYPLFVFIVTLGYFATQDPRSTSVGVDYLMALLPISNLYRLQYGVYGGVLFSVAIELQFYLIFPVLIAMWRSRGIPYLLLLIGFFILLRAMIFHLTGTAHQFAYFSIFGNLDIFVIGMIAGLIYKKYDGRAIAVWWVLGVFAAINLVIFALHRHPSFFHFDYASASHNEVSRSLGWIFWPTVEGVMWAALLLAYLKSDLRIPLASIWSYLGKISYSLYVWHTIICMIVVRHAAVFGSPFLTGLLVILPASILVAALSYHLIETPFLSMRVRYTTPLPGGTAGGAEAPGRTGSSDATMSAVEA